MTEKITNLHPKDDSSTTIYPNTKSECIIDKDISSYVSGHVPDSALVQKTTESIYTKLDTKIDDTKVELMKEINEVDSTLIDEINERENSDNLIRTDMETADKDLQSKITSLTTELSNETTERKNDISSIQEDLTTLDNSLLSTNGRVNTLENEMVNAHEDISSNKTNIETILSSYIDKSSAQTITGSKTFKQPIKSNEIDNENGNAMLRYKETEGKNVVGGSNYPLTLMGSEDRPSYSKDGSDFEGNPLALKSDVETEKTERKSQDTALQTNINSNWSTLMGNLGIGRWRNQDFFTDYESSNIIYDSMLPQYSNYSYCFANVGFADERTGQYNAKPTVMNNGFSFTKSTSSTDPWNRKKMNGVFFGWKNASALTIKLNASDENLISNFSYVFNCGQMTSINVENGVLKPSYVYLPFYNCPNLVSVDGIDMSNGLSCTFELTGCPKVKHLGITHWKLSFSIGGSTAFEEADLVEIISNLDTVTSTQTLTMGATNLAKLTDDEKKVATDKGWTLA